MTCEPCLNAETTGAFGLPARWSHCRSCHASWSGLNRCHCTRCCRTLGGVAGFERHLDKGRGGCPSDRTLHRLGLSRSDAGIWVRAAP